MMKRLYLRAEIFQDMNCSPISFVVEAIDVNGEGSVYLARFTGPNAEEYAIEYAQSKYASYKLYSHRHKNISVQTLE